MIKLLKEMLGLKEQVKESKYDRYFKTKSQSYPHTHPSFGKLSTKVQNSVAPVLDGLIANPKFKGLEVSAVLYNSLEVLYISTKEGYRIQILYTPAGTLRRIRVQKNGKYGMLNTIEALKSIRDNPAAVVEWINNKADEIVQPGYTYRVDKPKGE